MDVDQNESVVETAEQDSFLSRSFAALGGQWGGQSLLLLAGLVFALAGVSAVFAAGALVFVAVHGAAEVAGIASSRDNFLLFLARPQNRLAGSLLGLIAVFVGMRLFAWFLKAMHHLALRPERGARTALQDAKTGGFSFMLLLIVQMLLIDLGFALLVLPGVAAAVFFSMAPFHMAARGGGVMDALGSSARLIQGHFWQAFGRGLLLFFIVLLISLVPLVGSLLGAALWMAAWGLYYRDLSGELPAMESLVADAPSPAAVDVPNLAKADRRAVPREDLSPYKGLRDEDEGEEAAAPEPLPEFGSAPAPATQPAESMEFGAGDDDLMPDQGTPVDAAPGRRKPILVLLLVLAGAAALAAGAWWWLRPPSGAVENRPVSAPDKAAPAHRANPVPAEALVAPEPFTAQWSAGTGKLLALAGDHEGKVYALDAEGARLLKFDYQGKALAPLADSRLVSAKDLAVDEKGYVYVSLGGGAKGQDMVLRWDPLGQPAPSFRGSGRDDGKGLSAALACDGRGRIYVYDPVFHSVAVFDLNGKLLGRRQPPGEAADSYVDLAAGPEGSLYALRLSGKVDVFSLEGKPLEFSGFPGVEPEPRPVSLAVDWDGRLWAAATAPVRLIQLNSKGSLVENLELSGDMQGLGALYVDPWGGLYAVAQPHQRLLVRRDE